MAGLPPDTNTIISEGYEYAQKAISHDYLACQNNDPKDFDIAKTYYLRAIDQYMIALRWETNDRVKANLRDKVNSYLDRAEIMKAWLDKHGKMRAAFSSMSFEDNGGQNQLHRDTNPSNRDSQLEMLDVGHLINVGSEFAVKAVGYDRLACQGNNPSHFGLAKAFYLDVLRYYMAALRNEHNERVQAALREKIVAYLERAELMNAWLEKYGKGPETMDTSIFIDEGYSHTKKAIENDKRACRGNNPEDFQASMHEYLTAVQYYETALEHEQSEQVKQSLREKILNYRQRAQVMKDWLAKYKECKSSVISDVTSSFNSGRQEEETDAEELIRTIVKVELDAGDMTGKKDGDNYRRMLETSLELTSLKRVDIDGKNFSEICDKIRTLK